MTVVNASVKNRIMIVPDDVELVCNNPTDVIEIEFDAEWNGKTGYVARFEWNGKYIDVPFTGSRVKVPELSNTAWIMFGVYADDLASTPAKVKCKKSVLCYGSEVRQPPANPFYDEFAERLEGVEKAIEQGGGTIVSAVSSVNGKTGAVMLTADDVGAQEAFEFGAADAGKLVYIGADGLVSLLRLGEGLMIVDGVLKIVNVMTAAICGTILCGQAVCGQGV